MISKAIYLGALKLAKRIKVVFKGQGFIPANYNYYLSSFIYRSLPKHMRDFLHDIGFRLEKRVFKLFVFSRIFGDLKFKRLEERALLELNGEAYFYLSSLWDDFIKAFTTNVLKHGEVKIYKSKFKIDYIEAIEPPKIKNKNRIIMLSPIVAQRTYISPSGIKKTRFYSPWEPTFNELLNKNLYYKYQVAVKYGILPRLGIKKEVKFTPLEVDEIRDRVVIIYGNNKNRKVLEGWLGKYVISGPKTLIKIGYYTGLLYGNPKGLGMFEVI